MTSTTPGPWEVVPLSGSGGPYAIRMAYPDPKQPTFYGVRQVAWEQDAHLIAAAPDLLDALDKCVTNWSALGGHADDWLHEARAALAKARGATP